jgi:hypothetical protein
LCGCGREGSDGIAGQKLNLFQFHSAGFDLSEVENAVFSTEGSHSEEVISSPKNSCRTAAEKA